MVEEETPSLRLDTLPDDLIGEIIGHLDSLVSWARLSVTCKRLYSCTAGCPSGMPFGMRHVALTENWVAKDLSDMKFRNLVISGPLHSLERLDLHSFGRITVFGLSHLRLVPSLRAITLGTPRVPYQDYALAFSCMTQLTELNIERARLSKNDACAIATLSGLRRLELAECTWVNPDSVCRLASLASHLESLSLQGCSSITVEPLGTLSQLTRLTSLDLSGCTSVGEGVSEMLSGLSDLRTCALRCCHLTDECMAALGALTCLRLLDLRQNPEITSVGLGRLARLTNLEKLDIRLCGSIGDEGLAALEGMHHLAELDVSFCPLLRGRALLHVAPMTCLRELRCCRLDRLTDESLSHLCHLETLQVLDVSGCKCITSAGLSSLLESLPGLLQLYVADIPGLDDSVLSVVGKLLLLRVLSLARCGNVTDEGVACLAGLHQVVSLHLGGVHQVTDAALADVAGLERLRTLSLRHCTRLTDVALQHLSTSKSLLELDIVGCHSLTNSGLAALATLRLRRVDLAGCKGIAGSCVRPDVQLISEAAALCPDGRDGT